MISARPHRAVTLAALAARLAVVAATLVAAIPAGSCDGAGGDAACVDDLDCRPDERCTSTGICVPGAGECAASEECPGLGTPETCGDVVVYCIGGECRYSGECLRLGGRVEGLVGRGLVLANGAEFLPVDADGVFQFETLFGHGDRFAVIVATQPVEPAQVCAVKGGDGVFDFSDVATVRVTCSFRSDDTDGDGVCDGPNLAEGCVAVHDNCLGVANKSQRDGDEDGVGDACDPCTDADGDGYGRGGLDQSGCAHAGDDCNDQAAAAHPDQLERCDDGLDNDCDGETDEADCQRPYRPPTAVDDAVELSEDAPATVVDVLANDEVWDDPSARLTIVSVTTPNNGGAAGIEQQGRRIRYRPAADFAGEETFAYTIEDGVGGSATAFVVVTVTPVNDPPRANPDVYSVPEDSAPSIFDVMGNDTSAPDEGEVLSITAVGTASQGGTVRLLLGGSVEYTPARDFFGEEAFNYILSDGNGATAIGGVTVRVLAVNDPPVVARALNDTVATEDTPWTWALPEGTFTDADGDPLAIHASIAGEAGLPPWLVFDAAAHTLTGSPRNADVGQTLLRVSATDPTGATASDIFVLTVVNTNDPPVVAKAIGDQHVAAGDVWAFVVPAATFSDIDPGDTLTLSAARATGEALPTWLAFDAATGLFVGTPRYADVGLVDLRVTATDAAGASATEVFRLAVSSDDAPPQVAAPIPPQSATVGIGWALAIPEGTFVDPDGDPLTVTAARSDGGALPAWLQFHAFTRVFAGTPGPDDVGDLELAVTVTDPVGASATDVFVVTVVP